jgi:hypothetical protein
MDEHSIAELMEALRGWTRNGNFYTHPRFGKLTIGDNGEFVHEYSVYATGNWPVKVIKPLADLAAHLRARGFAVANTTKPTFEELIEALQSLAKVWIYEDMYIGWNEPMQFLESDRADGYLDDGKTVETQLAAGDVRRARSLIRRWEARGPAIALLAKAVNPSTPGPEAREFLKQATAILGENDLDVVCAATLLSFLES